MSNSSTFLKTAAAILLAIAVISITIYFFQVGMDGSKDGFSKFTSMKEEHYLRQFAFYDHTKISGEDVLDALKRFSKESEFGIYVVTGKAKGTGIYLGRAFQERDGVAVLSGQEPNGNLDEVYDQRSIHYINPEGKFDAMYLLDANRRVVALRFVQDTR